MGKAVGTSDEDGEVESPPASVALDHNGATPHRGSDTSLSSETAAGVSGRQPARIEPSIIAPARQTSRGFDMSSAFPRYGGPTSPQGLLLGSNSLSSSSPSPVGRGDLVLEHHTRMELLGLEEERAKMKLIKLQLERKMITLNQQIAGVASTLPPQVQETFASPATSGQLQSRRAP